MVNVIFTVLVCIAILLVGVLFFKNRSKYEGEFKFPKKLFQTYHSIDKIPEYIHAFNQRYAAGYEITILDDAMGLEFLQKNFDPNVVEKYNELSGAHKADLLRYCLLYIHGGVYMDVKTILTKPIDTFLEFDGKSHQLYSVNSINKNTVYQGFIASTQSNPIFLKLIDGVLKTPVETTKQDYLVFTRQMYDIVKDDDNVVLFSEKCTRSGKKKKDRYGLFCESTDEDGNNLFNIRDPNYPY